MSIPGRSSLPAEPDWSLELELRRAHPALQGKRSRGRHVALEGVLIAGVDEAGRGALCGPVAAAAVILEPGRAYPFRDSKTVPEAERAELAEQVRAEAIAFAVAFATSREVDELNVLGATRLAARRAVAALRPAAAGLVTDYLRLGLPLPELAVAGGDSRSYQIAAASLLAKTARDDHMRELAQAYPGYGFERHKGYGVKAHLLALERLGPCPEHRSTFAPLRSRTTEDPEADRRALQ